MLIEVLQNKAVHYVCGAMEAAERENFEIFLEYQKELRAEVSQMQEAAASLSLCSEASLLAPPRALKTRLLDALDRSTVQRPPDGLVVTNSDGLIEWVNEGFTGMCGYALAELKGQKPGRVLQGPATDHEVVARVRAALQNQRECHEVLVNYHKDGTLYRVELKIAGILDDEGKPLAFVAREWKLGELAV